MERFNFTPKEQEVFKLFMLSGSSNKQMARDLDCSESNVKSVMHRIMHKVGARTRCQLASFFRDK